MKKALKKFVSVFLAVLMVITVTPMGVYATETEETNIVQVSELEESRNLYSKTYETSEDTNVVISAAVPLHFEKDGELKEIDNTLVKSGEDSSVLTNKSNAYNVELPKKYTEDSEIKIDYEDNSISFKLLNDIKASKGDVSEAESIEIDETNAENVAYAQSNMDKLSSVITYENLLTDIDLEYSVQPDTLKENIILNKIPDENYSVQYELNTGVLNAVLNANNTITLFDGDKEVFVIESPYMIDANDTISEDVAVSLEKTENGYVLTYTPDYSWLANKNIVYPVTIDPTVKMLGKESENSNIVDTYVGNRLSTPQVNSTTVSVQNSSSTKYWAYYNIKNLPDLPANSQVTNMSLNLTTTARVTSAAQLALYSLDSITDDSYVNNVVYSTASDATESDKITDISAAPTNSGSNFSFDLTGIADKLYSRETNNFILKEISGTAVVKIASSEHTDTSKIPYVSVEFVTANGIKDSYQYSTQNLNLGGTAYVNDYTGNLIVERTEFASQNNEGITFYIGEGVNTPENSCFGENTSINYCQTLAESSFEDSQYVLTYGDGSKEYISNSDEKYTIVKDDDNNTIVVSYYDNDDYINKAFTIENDNNATAVDDKFVLTTIETIKNKNKTSSSPLSNITTISYDGGYLVSMENDIAYYEFEYEDYLSKITCFTNINTEEGIINTTNPNEYVINSYTWNNNLTKISFENTEAIIEYHFDENNNLVKAVDETGLSYEYTYNDNNQVIKVQEFSGGYFDNQNNFVDTNEIAGDYLTFEYGNNTTTISDRKDTYTEYFDLAGNLESIVDQNGNAVFAQYKDNLISKISQTRNSARNIADFYGFESSNDSFFTTNNATVAVSSDAKFNGNSSVKLVTPAYTQALFTGKINNLDKNSTYTVSMWINKDENTDCSLTLTNGDDSGIFTTVNSQPTNGWQQFYCTIDTEESNYLNVALTVDNSGISSATNIYVDNMYIQKSPYLTNINLLTNGDFSNGLNSWVTESNNISIKTEDANISTADNNRLKITGDYLGNNSISQTVPITATQKGTKYTYGGWLKSVDSLPAKEDTNREISLSVYGISSDGANTLLDKTTYSSYLSNWQYIENEFALPDDNITQLKFVISYNYQTGYVMFDGLSLSQDELYTIAFEYDENNKITSIITNGTTIPLTEEDDNTDAESTHTDTYEYDSYGNVSKITETISSEDVPESIISKFEYGNNGSLLTKNLGPIGRWIDYGYDYFGNIASVNDANGNTVKYEYDNFQNLSSIISQFTNKDVDNSDEVATVYDLKVQYTYTGNRLDKIETGNIENDVFIPFNTYAFEYDDWGNQTDIYINDMEHPYIHYIYDETNYHQLNTVEYINGQKISYIYDNDGNIIYEYDSDNTNGDSLSYSYYYYDNGTCYGKKDLITGTIESYQDGLTTITDANGNILHSYGYDENGNLLEQIGNNFIATSTSSDSSTLTTTVNDSLTSIVSQEFDDFGRVTSEKIPINDSSYILREYTYCRIDETFNQGIDSLIESASGKTEHKSFVGDFDSTNLVRELSYYLVNGDNIKTPLYQYRYVYSPNGDVLSYTIVRDNFESPTLKNIEKLNIHNNNESNMILSDVNNTYEYDSHGNIVSIFDDSKAPRKTVATFSYDSQNSGTAVTNCLTNYEYGDNSYSLHYDEMGNLENTIYYETDEEIDSYRYKWTRGNILDSIIEKYDVLSETDGSFETYEENWIDYQYDDNNLRTQKRIISYEDTNPIDTTTNYIWRNGILAGEEMVYGDYFYNVENLRGKYNTIILYDQNDNAYGFVLNKTADENGNTVNTSETYYYIKDNENTIRAIIDQNGNKIITYDYDPYGVPTITYPNNIIHTNYKYLEYVNPLIYKDYIYDTETRMYYLQSRYYSPYTGRFISADNVFDTGSGTAMCTNLYSYCENNPINHSDPTGYWAQNYRGFKWTSKGFNLYVNYAFVNKTFCRSYALDILKLKRTSLYKGMSVTRMAAELYFHAILYYATNALTKIGVKSSTIRNWRQSAYYMEINNDDNRVKYFYALWGLSNAVIGRYL